MTTSFAIRSIILAVAAMLLWPSAAPALVGLWAHGYGGASDEILTTTAVQSDGTIVAAGAFRETGHFGPGLSYTSNGQFDIYMLLVSKSGTTQRARAFGAAQTDLAVDLVVDGDDNIIVAGYFSDTVNFGEGNILTSNGGTDIFLAKYDSNLNCLWASGFGNTNDDHGLGVATDAANNVFLTGYYEGNVGFGGFPFVGAGGRDGFLAKYDSDGNYLWDRAFGSTQRDEGRAISVDAAGDVTLIGLFTGTVWLGSGSHNSAGSTDVCILKYNASGSWQWTRAFGGTGTDTGEHIAVDGAGNVIVIGEISSAVDLGGGAIGGFGAEDVFLAKYDAGGVHLWSQAFGNIFASYGYTVEVDGNGDILTTGYFSGLMSLGGAPLPGNNIDAFVARYDASGAHLWSEHYGTPNAFDYGVTVSVGSDGNVVLGGSFDLSVDFAGMEVTTHGGMDGYLLTLSDMPAAPSITSVVDVPNDEGREVEIRFSRPAFDQAAAGNPVIAYEVYRQDGADGLVQNTVARAEPEGSVNAEGWTWVASAPAHGENTYAVIAPTAGDSTVSHGDYPSTFFVRAATAVPMVFHDSPAAGGYSIDNLAPPVPAGLSHGASQLSWNESPADDFDYFTVYGAASGDFGAAVVIDYTTAQSMDVSGAPYAVLFVTATDEAGNESGPASITPLTGAGGGPQRYVLAVTNYPNPFNPRTAVRYTLPYAGAVTIDVFDAHGARVTSLVSDEPHVAGAHVAEWDGRDHAGAPVSSGVYFARISHGGETRARKMILLK